MYTGLMKKSDSIIIDDITEEIDRVKVNRINNAERLRLLKHELNIAYKYRRFRKAEKLRKEIFEIKDDAKKHDVPLILARGHPLNQ